MIGAMPAVAVRHERRKRKPRPTQLYFVGSKQSPPSKGSTPSQSQAGSPASPSMLAEAQGHRQSQAEQQISALQPPPEFYVCGRVSVLHVVVVSLLLGSILLVVGLVQLKPGADASRHRLYFLSAGTLLLTLGMILIFIRCCCCQSSIQQHHPGRRRLQKDDSAASAIAHVGNEENLPHIVTSTNGNHTSKKVAVIDEIEVPSIPNKLDSSDACQSLSIDLGVPMHSSHDTLQSVKSPSEHDALIKKSNSNLEANSLT
ncbi:hypothetical protein J437_LFUL007765 [Ladona fulva]|uniref:Uncharacterized protein n=1 Tax=Ladona fulva TaxID=123851 RepID=A0A8K0P0R2_LADFU|nr:hypothetical protein J437_LFUL007765 [Ladona fulva]